MNNEVIERLINHSGLGLTYDELEYGIQPIQAILENPDDLKAAQSEISKEYGWGDLGKFDCATLWGLRYALYELGFLHISQHRAADATREIIELTGTGQSLLDAIQLDDEGDEV